MARSRARVSREVVSELAPTGILRVAINLSNFLLVSGLSASGEPYGVAPAIGAELARCLGIPVGYQLFEKPDALADAVDLDLWDVALIAAEPQRAQHIAFTSAYAEIAATFLVPDRSHIRAIAEVDRPGTRIASARGAAYDLWLDRNIRHATLIRANTLDACFRVFVEEGLDALAGLRPRLMSDVRRLPGARLLDGTFASVQQAIGTSRKRMVAQECLQAFVDDIVASGLVARLIKVHDVRGLVAAEPG
jgi:polar amino acid transport system substrate-binding protein